MNAEELHKKKLEENALAHGLASLAEKAKTGRLVSPKVLAIMLAVVLIGGIWWYFSNQSKKTESQRWTKYEEAGSVADYKVVAEANPKTTVALAARLSAARLKFTSEGLARFNIPKEREGAINAIDAARKELKELAGEFEKSGNRGSRTEALRLAAMAEVALIGVPKPGTSALDAMNPANQLGSAAAAVELFNTAAKVIGESTEAGENLKQQGADLAAAADRKDISDVMSPQALGKYINDLLVYVPETKIEPKAPDKPLDPIQPPKPPEGTQGTRGTRR